VGDPKGLLLEPSLLQEDLKQEQGKWLQDVQKVMEEEQEPPTDFPV